MTTASILNGADERGRSAETKPEPIRREVYLTLRLRELSQTIHEHATERERLNAILKDRAAEKGAKVRALRNRRGYLTMRLAILRDEQRSLAAEKDALTSGFLGSRDDASHAAEARH
jgi:hypothetical protein